MKRKRISLIITAVLVMVMSLGSLSYADETKSGPTLTEILMSSNDIKPEDEFEISFKAYDSSSGIQDINLTWMLEGTDGEGRNSYTMSVSGTEKYKFSIEASTYSGKWLIKEAVIRNGNNDSTTYTREQNYDLLKNLDFTFAGKANPNDKQAPELKSIKVVESEYTAPGTVTLEAEITDDKSDEVTAQVNYVSALPKQDESPIIIGDMYYSITDGTNMAYMLEKQANGKYQVTIDLPNKYLKWQCLGVRLEDQSGNSVTYTEHAKLLQDLYGNGENYIKLDTNIDLTPSNYQEDTKTPTMESFQHNSTKLYPPSMLITRLDLKDDESGFGDFCGYAFYKNEKGDYEKGVPIERALDDEGSQLDYYNAKLELPRYEDPGELYLDRVVFTDAVGNRADYSVSAGTLKKQLVTVASDLSEYTLKTSTTEEDYIAKISALQNGSKVLCDIATEKVIPKKLFDKIKGKDITITFEDIYGEASNKQGIQWIINGRDIVNDTIDVDMTIKLSDDVYCPWILKDYKFTDVDYDESLPEDERVEKAREQQRKIATDYWNYLKELGYENTDEYLEKTINEINTGDTEASSAIMQVMGYTHYLSIKFAENGLLPCKSIVRIKPEYATRHMIGAKNLYLFYIDGNEYSQVDDGISMSDDAYYDLTITHNSEYWLTQADINDVPKPDGTVKPGDSEKPGDGGSSDSGKQDPAKDNAGSTDQVKGSDNAAANTANADANAAKTGDHMNLPLLIGVMIAAAFAAILTVCMRRRKTNVK